MKQMNRYLGIFLTGVLLGMPVAQAKVGTDPKKNCTVSNSSELPIAGWNEATPGLNEEGRNDSLRNLVGMFNRAEAKLQRCQQSIKLNHSVDLRYPIIFQGASGGADQLEFDGGGNTLSIRDDFVGNCIIKVRGDAREVLIKNLKIVGNSWKDGKGITGICLESRGNVLDNVRIVDVSGAGVKISELANKIRGGSVIASTGEQAVLVTSDTSDVAAGDREYVSADTVFSANNRTHADKIELPALQLENVSPKYVVTYTSDEADGAITHTLNGDVFLPAGLNGPTTAGMKLLVYRWVGDISSDSAANLTLGNILLAGVGDIAQYGLTAAGDDSLSKTSDKANFQVSWTSSGIADDQIFLRLVPFTETSTGLASTGEGSGTAAVDQNLQFDVALTSTSIINLGGVTSSNEGSSFTYIFENGKGKICSKEGYADLNKCCDVQVYNETQTCVDPGQSAASASGDSGSSAGGATDANAAMLPKGANTASAGTGTPEGDWKLALAQVVKTQNDLIDKCKKQEFYNNPIKQATIKDVGLIDADGDLIPDAVEDPMALCNGDRFDIDSDDDGLIDSAEDFDYNGYVTCSITKKSGTGAGQTGNLYPNFMGKDSSNKPCAITKDPLTDALTSTSATCTPVKVNRLGGDAQTLIPLLGGPSFEKGRRVKVKGNPQYNDFDANSVVCLETDPSVADTDGDGLGDGVELQRKFIDRTAGAHLYSGLSLEHLNPVSDSQGDPLACPATMLAGNSKTNNVQPATQWGLVTLPGTKYITIFVCKSEGIDAGEGDGDLKSFDPLCTEQGADTADTADDVITCDPDMYGRTDPRLANSDLDAQGNDNQDKCPTNPEKECKKQCFWGWRADLIQNIAKISYSTTGEQAKSQYDAAYSQVADLFGKFDLASAQAVVALGIKNTFDEDNIPDLVEAGLAAPNTVFNNQDDCTDEVLKYAKVGNQTNLATAAFLTWTDKKRFGDALDDKKLPKTDGNITSEFNDGNDPCPGILDKTTCTQGQPQTRIVYQSTAVPLIGCFIDRDRDTLMDCVEDRDGDGNLNSCSDKTGTSQCESAVMLSDSDGDGLIDAEDEFPLLKEKDSDSDGLTDAQERRASGEKGVYESSLGVKRTCAEVISAQITGNQSVFDTDPAKSDTDEDGVNDGTEIQFRTNPNSPDSDGDGLCDYDQDVVIVKCADGTLGVGHDVAVQTGLCAGNTNGTLMVACIAGEDVDRNGKHPVAGDESTWDMPLGKDAREESDPCDGNTDARKKSGELTNDLKGDADDECKTNPALYCAAPGTFGTDSDSDGIVDKSEKLIGTDPENADSDGDGLQDGCIIDENGQDRGELCNMIKAGPITKSFNKFNQCGTAPYAKCDTSPLNADSDGDSLNDGFERNLATNPRNQDSDGDCIVDGKEAITVKQFPDGSQQLSEATGQFVACTVQVNPRSGVAGKVCTMTDPNNADSDGDGLCDGFCYNQGEDLDCDGLVKKFVSGVNALDPANPQAQFAQLLETDPRNWDTDTDGVSDFEEMTSSGFFNRLNFSLATSGGQGGCSLILE